VDPETNWDKSLDAAKPCNISGSAVTTLIKKGLSLQIKTSLILIKKTILDILFH